MTDQIASKSDTQSTVILEMEKKLNPTAFWRRFKKNDRFCTISTAQYWDWLTYIDVGDSIIILDVYVKNFIG